MNKEKKFFVYNNTSYTIVTTGNRWYVEYYLQLPAGVKVRKREYGNINREKDLLKRWELALDLIKNIANNSRPITSKKKVLLATLEQNKVLYRKKTYQTYISRLDFFYKWLGDKSDLDITASEANDFIRFALSKKENGTVRGYRRTLSSLYNKYSDSYNPFEKSIQPPKTYKSLYYFNDVEIGRLKEYLSNNMPTIWFAAQLLFYCFIRPGEMRKLEVNDINLSYGFIEIRSEVSKNKKTQKVAIPNHFKNIMETYLKGKSGLLFKNKFGKMVGINYFNKEHRLALNELGIIGRYAFYSWKHTGAVKAVKAGINLKDLQMQLRHHSLDMVNEYLKNLGVMDSEDLRYKFPKI